MESQKSSSFIGDLDDSVKKSEEPPQHRLRSSSRLAQQEPLQKEQPFSVADQGKPLTEVVPDTPLDSKVRILASFLFDKTLHQHDLI